MHFSSATTTVTALRAPGAATLTVADNTVGGCLTNRGISALNTVPLGVFRDGRMVCVLSVTGTTGATTFYVSTSPLYSTTDQTLLPGDTVQPFVTQQTLDALPLGAPLAAPSMAATRSGFADWNFDPALVATAAGTILVSGTQTLAKIIPSQSFELTNVNLWLGTAGATLTSAQNLVGIYDGVSGAKLAYSDDQTTAFAGTLILTVPLLTAGATGSKVTLTGGRPYYVCVLSVGTTPPKLAMHPGLVALSDANLAAASFRWAANGTSKTALDATLTLSSNSHTGALAYWCGIN